MYRLITIVLFTTILEQHIGDALLEKSIILVISVTLVTLLRLLR